MAAIPDVQAAGAVSALPFHPAGIDYDLPVVVEGRPRPRAGEEPQADFRVATPGYFRAVEIPLVKGRGFMEADGPNSPAVVIINETMARQIFAGEEAVVGACCCMGGRERSSASSDRCAIMASVVSRAPR